MYCKYTKSKGVRHISGYIIIYIYKILVDRGRDSFQEESKSVCSGCLFQASSVRIRLKISPNFFNISLQGVNFLNLTN